MCLLYRVSVTSLTAVGALGPRRSWWERSLTRRWSSLRTSSRRSDWWGWWCLLPWSRAPPRSRVRSRTASGNTAGPSAAPSLFRLEVRLISCPFIQLYKTTVYSSYMVSNNRNDCWQIIWYEMNTTLTDILLMENNKKSGSCITPPYHRLFSCNSISRNVLLHQPTMKLTVLNRIDV